MPAAISYVRFSSHGQRRGASEVRQGEGAEAWCEKHGYVLDTSVKPDKGRSGYHGDHVKKGHLGSFLKRVEDGAIPTGSVLIIEHLDRFTRQDPDTGYLQISKILNKGIDIVTLMDGERYTAHKLRTDIGSTIKIMLTLFQGHAESDKKSIRQTDNWKRLRTKMRDGKAKHAICPAWIDRKTREIIPEKAQIIRRIYRMALDGLGCGVITRTFNSEGVPPIKRGGRWYQQSIKQYLTTKAVLGEYQPCRIVEGQRIPDGDPIADFYPAIITPGDFIRVQLLFADRKTRDFRGQSYQTPNLFTGLLFSMFDGGRYHYKSNVVKIKGKEYPQRKLVPYAKIDGVPGCMDIALYYDAFESAFFRFVREVDVMSLFTRKDTEGKAEELQRLQGDVFEIGERLKATKNRIKLAKSIDALLSLVEEMDYDRKTKLARMEVLRSQLVTNESKVFDEVRTALGDPESRPKISSSLRLMIDQIDILPIHQGNGPHNRRQYLLFVRVRFHNKQERWYVTDSLGADRIDIAKASMKTAPHMDAGRQYEHSLFTAICGCIQHASPLWKDRLLDWSAMLYDRTTPAKLTVGD